MAHSILQGLFQGFFIGLLVAMAADNTRVGASYLARVASDGSASVEPVVVHETARAASLVQRGQLLAKSTLGVEDTGSGHLSDILLATGDKSVNVHEAALQHAMNVVESDIEVKQTSMGLLSEARSMQMVSRNPNATKEACDLCVGAEDALVANLTALSTSQTELSAAQTKLQEATSAHDTCGTELATASTATSAAKKSVVALHTSIGVHISNDDAESGKVTAAGAHSLATLLTAWSTAKTAQTTKDSECVQKLTSKESAATDVQTKQQAVTDASTVKQTAEAAAASACATMRKSGHGAPTPLPTPAPTQNPTPAPTTPAPTPANDGDYLILEEYNHRLLRCPAAGTGNCIPAAGTGVRGKGADQLQSPMRFTMASDGDFVIADHGNHRIQKCPRTGLGYCTTVAGTGVLGSGVDQLHSPIAVVIDGNGDYVIAERAANRIRHCPAAGGSCSVVAGSATGVAGCSDTKLTWPWDMTIALNGDYVFPDKGCNRIQRCTAGDTFAARWSCITVAGTGSKGSGSDEFDEPIGVSLHRDNEDYLVADGSNHRIQRCPASGTGDCITVAGTGVMGSGSDQFQHPSQAVVASNGEYIVVDAGNNRVQRCPAAGPGSCITVAGNGGKGSRSNQMDKPYHLIIEPHHPTPANTPTKLPTPIRAITVIAGAGAGESSTGGNALNQFRKQEGSILDAAGNCIVADTNNNRIMKWAPGAAEGTVVAGKTSDQGGNALNLLVHPKMVRLDAAGNYLIADYYNERIMKWAPGAAEGTMVAGHSEKHDGRMSPMDFILDTAGNFIICDSSYHRILKWAAGALTGDVVIAGNGAGDGLNQLNYPHSLAIDASGNYIVSDSHNHRIVKWVPGAANGEVVAGGNGQGAARNQFSYPYGLAIDAAGDYIVVDHWNHRVMKWVPGASQGQMVAGSGKGGKHLYQLAYPSNIYIDSAKDRYIITDKENYRILAWPCFYGC